MTETLSAELGAPPSPRDPKLEPEAGEAAPVQAAETGVLATGLPDAPATDCGDAQAGWGRLGACCTCTPGD